MSPNCCATNQKQSTLQKGTILRSGALGVKEQMLGLEYRL